MNISNLLTLFEMKVHYPLRFAFYKLIFKQDKNRYLFADAYSSDLTDNMKPVYAALEKRDGAVLVKCFPKGDGLFGNSFIKKLKGRIKRFASFEKFIREYARCGTVFLTETYLPAYAVAPQKGTEVVQLWHACGAFKKWGYSVLGKEFGASDNKIPMHNCYTLVPVSSDKIITQYAEAFGCSPEIIKPLGVPRTDELLNCKNKYPVKEINIAKEKFLKAHPEFREKKLVLYAPTFRGKNLVEAKFDAALDLEKLQKSLEAQTGKDNGFAVLLKLHPLVKQKPTIPDKCKAFCIDVSDSDTNEILKSADILITDYSSIIFEYSLFDLPILFYAYDLDGYKDNRDFYYDYENFVPGPILKTQEELAASLLNIDDVYLKYKDKITDFRQKYMSACDGNSTEKILKELL